MFFSFWLADKIIVCVSLSCYPVITNVINALVVYPMCTTFCQKYPLSKIIRNLEFFLQQKHLNSFIHIHKDNNTVNTKYHL